MEKNSRILLIQKYKELTQNVQQEKSPFYGEPI